MAGRIRRDDGGSPLAASPLAHHPDMIRCLTLDWGDTLAVNYGMPYRATQRRCFLRLAEDLRAAGGTVPAEGVETWIAELAVDWHRSVDVQANPEHREFDLPGLLQTWIARAAVPAAAAAAAQAALAHCTDRMCDTVIPYAEALPALRDLRQRGLRIGILSHVPWPGDACRRWFTRHGLAPFIDFYSLSSEVGWIKPNPRHFTHALALAQVAPHEILHVGDHPLRDVEGARRAGFRTCLRRTEGIYDEAALGGCAPDAEILHLDELPAAVAAMAAG